MKVRFDGHVYFIDHKSSQNGIDEFVVDSVGEFHKHIRIDHNAEVVSNVIDEEANVCGYYHLTSDRSMEEVMVELVQVCVANEYY